MGLLKKLGSGLALATALALSSCSHKPKSPEDFHGTYNVIARWDSKVEEKEKNSPGHLEEVISRAKEVFRDEGERGNFLKVELDKDSYTVWDIQRSSSKRGKREMGPLIQYNLSKSKIIEGEKPSASFYITSSNTGPIEFRGQKMYTSLIVEKLPNGEYIFREESTNENRFPENVFLATREDISAKEFFEQGKVSSESKKSHPLHGMYWLVATWTQDSDTKKSKEEQVEESRRYFMNMNLRNEKVVRIYVDDNSFEQWSGPLRKEENERFSLGYATEEISSSSDELKLGIEKVLGEPGLKEKNRRRLDEINITKRPDNLYDIILKTNPSEENPIEIKFISDKRE